MHADHGWHLGEYNMWEKRTLWENAARVPLVLRAPWLPQSAGTRVAAPVELVDIFKTVCDALGLTLTLALTPTLALTLTPTLTPTPALTLTLTLTRCATP